MVHPIDSSKEDGGSVGTRLFKVVDLGRTSDWSSSLVELDFTSVSCGSSSSSSSASGLYRL